MDMEDSTTKEEIATTLATIGGCSTNELRVSDIQRTAKGVRIAWLQCSVEAAIMILNEEKLRIGWATVKCEMAPPKPLRCFKCLETGHSRQNCRSEIDRSNNCYNCGELGHSAAQCNKNPECIICKYYRKRYDHRIGSTRCTSITQEERRGVRNRRADDHAEIVLNDNGNV